MKAPDPAAVRAQVSRILASPRFAASERLSRFLNFVSEEAVEGRGDQIKEYVIGIAVYDKPASYEPRTDSTVRGEASKLRARLREYYATDGCDDDILIEIPKGAYQPVFQNRVPERTGASAHRRASVLVALLGLLAIVFTWFAWSRHLPPRLPVAVIPLTSYPGSESRPSFSPDGTQFAFSWDGNGGNADIYVRLVAGAEPLRLTTDPAPDLAPAWSPDGRFIAFLRTQGGKSFVFLVSPLGGMERKLNETVASSLAWTPDSLAWTPDSQSLVLVQRASPDAPSDIELISIQTGERSRLTAPPTRKYWWGDLDPAISPDGRTLAFVRWSARTAADLYVQPFPSSTLEPRRLTLDKRSIHGIAWTPDSREIVFSSNRGGDQSLWRISAAGGQPQRVDAAGENALSPALSRVGRLAFERQTEDKNIWSLDALTHTTRRLIASTREERTAEFSPDGGRIAFASDRSGALEIWVCDRDGSNAIQITSLGGHSRLPRWSPDGNRIAFDARVSDTDGDIYVVGARGGSLRRLTAEPSDDVRPSWSAGGKWIYFRSDRGGSRQIWKMPAEGGAPIQVTRDGADEAFLSPDELRLYFMKGAQGVWTMPFDDPGSARPVPGLESVLLNSWAIADPGIYFIDAGGRINLFHFATGKTSVVGAATGPLAREAPCLSATRDGHTILWTQTDHAESDLVLLEHFR
jgi:Tol biopolymer transport system component